MLLILWKKEISADFHEFFSEIMETGVVWNVEHRNVRGFVFHVG